MSGTQPNPINEKERIMQEPETAVEVMNQKNRFSMFMDNHPRVRDTGLLVAGAATAIGVVVLSSMAQAKAVSADESTDSEE